MADTVRHLKPHARTRIYCAFHKHHIDRGVSPSVRRYLTYYYEYSDISQ